jgi:hypothetical protein
VAIAAAEMAANGIATIGINAVGHGFGPRGTLTVSLSGDGTVTLPAGGRGIDQDGNGIIGRTEGYEAASPRTIISQRDGRIQTDADLMQLVRVIQAGVSVNGDGQDLDPSRIYYIGVSLSSQYGAPLLAVEGDVRAGVLNTVGPALESRRLSLNRSGTSGGLVSPGTFLASRVPPLLNPPGDPVITRLDGQLMPTPYYNENMPLRSVTLPDGSILPTPLPVTVRLSDGTTQNQVIQSPVTNTVAGAMAIQQAFENWEWVSQSSSPVAFAPHLRKDPLPGVPVRPVLVQFAKGDQSVPNPTTTAFLRAGGLADVATFYRHDLAYADDKSRLKNPHTFVGLITTPNMKAIALAAQQQIATFFASDGTEIIQPPGVPAKYFEVPIQGPLPEGLNYITDPPVSPATASGGSNDVSILLNGGVWDGAGSIDVQTTDLPMALLGLAFRPTLISYASAVGPFSAAPLDNLALTTPAEQGQQSHVVSEGHKGVEVRTLAAIATPTPSGGSKLFGLAALDQVFADSATSLDRDPWRLFA